MNEALNRIYNMECIEGMERLYKKYGNFVDLIITDPPYLHVKGGMKSAKYNVGTWKENSKMVSELSEFDKDKIYKFLDSSIKLMKKVNMFVFCSKLQLQYYFAYIESHKLKYDLLIWDKVKYSMKSTKFFTSDIEYVVRIYENGVSLRKIMAKSEEKSDISYYLKRQAYPQPRNGRHETEKPLELIEKYIKLASDEGQVVFDPFMGSGTTAIAALNTNRNFIGFELDKQYYEVANERIRNHLKE